MKGRPARSSNNLNHHVALKILGQNKILTVSEGIWQGLCGGHGCPPCLSAALVQGQAASIIPAGMCEGVTSAMCEGLSAAMREDLADAMCACLSDAVVVQRQVWCRDELIGYLKVMR